MQKLIESLSSISGVIAVGLGGSRGLGIANESSDYDFVLFRHGGDPIATPLIVDAVQCYSDSENFRVIEVFQKDLSQVAREIHLAKEGKFLWSSRQLFPHGDLSTNQISHIIYLILCADTAGSVSNLRQLAEPFPELLRRSLINFFLMQATITVKHASKIKKSVDLQYLLALCSAFVFYANIVLFSVNRRYPVIEKGGAKLIFDLPFCIQNYQQRIALMFQASCHGHYLHALSEMTAMLEELRALANNEVKSTITA